MKLSRFVAYILIPLILAGPAAAQQAAETPKPIWLVVTTQSLKPAVEPLASFRQAEGFEVVTSTRPVAEAIESLDRRPAFILLVGDDQDGKASESWYVAARRLKYHRWVTRQRKLFASDAAWGDLNDDLVPDVPVGRIPARTIEQAKLVVAKILAFEKRPPNLSTLRLPVWAGAAEFGALIDNITTSMLLSSLNRFGPSWAQPWVISSNPNFAWCGWPASQAADFTSQIKAGGVFSALIGHGSQKSFYSMKTEAGVITYKASDAETLLGKGEPTPPLAMICCLCGDFTMADDCLAESMLMLAGGPVATIAASVESHPVTNFYTGRLMLARLCGPQKRLGEFWLETQQATLKVRNPIIEFIVIKMQEKRGHTVDMEGIRSDHGLIYNVFGDPATNLKLPGKLEIVVRKNGDKWLWQAKKPKGAASLLVGLRSINIQRLKGNPKAMQKEARDIHAKANAMFEFIPLPAVDNGDGWQGTIDRPGLLRIVAVTPEKLYVATVVLAAPDAQN